MSHHWLTRERSREDLQLTLELLTLLKGFHPKSEPEVAVPSLQLFRKALKNRSYKKRVVSRKKNASVPKTGGLLGNKQLKSAAVIGENVDSVVAPYLIKVGSRVGRGPEAMDSRTAQLVANQAEALGPAFGSYNGPVIAKVDNNLTRRILGQNICDFSLPQVLEAAAFQIVSPDPDDPFGIDPLIKKLGPFKWQSEPSSQEAYRMCPTLGSSRWPEPCIDACHHQFMDFAADARIFNKDGVMSIPFSPQDISKSVEDLHNTLVLKFSQGRPPLVDIRYAISLSWGFKDSFVVGLLDSRHIIFKLSSADDFMRAWTRVPFIKGFIFRIFRWTPALDPKIESTIAPVWVQFPLLPLNFFNPSLLRPIAFSLGRVLRIDQSTLFLVRPSTTIVCIEMNIVKVLPKKLWMSTGKDTGFWQKLLYEPVPKFCSHCKL
ncbi:hypothetical protein HHK36_008737 [Tetracentron sinense]|uniref:DUF4283 domain-containing protein n=1 Tax=Tetracentron sinense TaxID=13715 RepID=A0A834ZHA2_TETSI|nr:hypothetical protein HHK36_008737 [Tetracentron sinense]